MAPSEQSFASEGRSSEVARPKVRTSKRSLRSLSVHEPAVGLNNQEGQRQTDQKYFVQPPAMAAALYTNDQILNQLGIEEAHRLPTRKVYPNLNPISFV